jgi:hypothetical protein
VDPGQKFFGEGERPKNNFWLPEFRCLTVTLTVCSKGELRNWTSDAKDEGATSNLAGTLDFAERSQQESRAAGRFGKTKPICSPPSLARPRQVYIAGGAGSEKIRA